MSGYSHTRDDLISNELQILLGDHGRRNQGSWSPLLKKVGGLSPLTRVHINYYCATRREVFLYVITRKDIVMCTLCNVPVLNTNLDIKLYQIVHYIYNCPTFLCVADYTYITSYCQPPCSKTSSYATVHAQVSSRTWYSA